MGQINLFDVILNLVFFQEIEPIDIKQIFQKIYLNFDKSSQIKYLQKNSVDISRKIKDKQLILTPFCIGNSVGACAWKMQLDLINILYLVSYNNYTEYHIESIDLTNLAKQRFDIIITDANHDQRTDDFKLSNQSNYAVIENQLTNALEQQQKKNCGNTLIMCYPNERFIEILLML